MSQHLKIGSTLSCRRGGKFKVDGHLDSGGQGSVYEATCLSTGNAVVIKTYHQGFDLDLAKTRIEFLIQSRLQETCRGLTTPVALIEQPTLAHVAPRVGQASLNELLQDGTLPSLQDRLVVAVALARFSEILESHGIIHGDVNPDNVRIDTSIDGIVGVHLIDFDNCSGPNLPPSSAYGSPLSMSPEARLALRHKQTFSPSSESDRYSLAVLLHELITLRNPCQLEMTQSTPQAFFKAMEQSQWTTDPATDASLHIALGGLPVASLTGSLYRYLKAGLTGRPEKRPCPTTWRKVLSQSVNQVILCPTCHAEMLPNGSRDDCHWCGHRFPVLKLKGEHTSIPLDRNGIVVGRKELGGSMQLSQKHAIFRRLGPETFLEPTGSNPTYRTLPNGRRMPLSNGTQYPLSLGDRLCLGNVEFRVSA